MWREFLKKDARTKRQFLKQRGVQVCREVCQLLREGDLSQVKQIASSLPLQQVPEWGPIHEIGKVIHEILPSLSLVQYSQFLPLMRDLRYESDGERDKEFYDRITSYLSQMQGEELMKWSCYLLSQNIAIFQPYRSQLQKSMEEMCEEKLDLSSKYLLNSTIIQGLMKNFFPISWVQNLPKQNIKPRTLDYLKLTCLDYPTLIADAPPYPHSTTEIKIGQFLLDLDYCVQINKNINHFEVDYLLGTNVVVQYHGTHHYSISRKKPKELIFSKWKAKMMENRGFACISIPFYEWQQHENEKEQKLYLIKKIESELLEKMPHNV